MNFTLEQLKKGLLETLPEDRIKLLSDRTIKENVETLYGLVTKDTKLEEFVAKTKNSFNSFAGQILTINRENALALEKAKKEAEKVIEPTIPKDEKKPKEPKSTDPAIASMQEQIEKMEKMNSELLEKMNSQETSSLVNGKVASLKTKLNELKVNKETLDSILPILTANITKDTDVDALYKTAEPMLNKIIASGNSSVTTSTRTLSEIPKDELAKVAKLAVSEDCNDFNN